MINKFNEWMTEKVLTIPLSAEIPEELADVFDDIVCEQGWIKKRAIAAAVRAFCEADDTTRYDLYKKAHDKMNN